MVARLCKFKIYSFAVVLGLCVYLVPTNATAQAFDLHCLHGAEAGNADVIGSMHLQVDLSNRQWCRGSCLTVEELVSDSDDLTIFVHGTDELDRIEKIALTKKDMTLLIEKQAGDAIWRENLACEKEEFGSFETYFGRDATPLVESRRFFELYPPMSAFSSKYKDNPLRVVIELTVNEDGVVDDCRIVESSAKASVDRVTCRNAKKYLLFMPSLDRNGKPTVGFWRRGIVYIEP